MFEDLGTPAGDVAGLRLAIVNVYGVRAADGAWVLVDTGLYGCAGPIREWARRHFGAAPPAAILLTHGHFDHIGSLRELAEGWEAPVYAHRLEVPYLSGRSAYPPPDPVVGGGAMAWMSPVYPRGPIDVGARLRTFEDGSVPHLPGWRWIHTPGHTAGHVSFFRDQDHTLIAGDAFVTTKQESLFAALTQRVELHGPPAYYTSDWDAAERSVRSLASLQPSTMVCGHGVPLSGPGAARALEELARDFRARAVPAKGRYVPSPAVTDETGTVSVPPPVVSPVPKLVLAGLAGAAVGIGLASLRRD